MLEKSDLEAIRMIVKEENSNLSNHIDEVENSLLDEIGRTQTYLEKQIEKVQKNLEELNQYYKITKLENDNTALLLKMIEELSRRIAELEKKTA